MTSAELIPAVILKRKAVVYVRQSTQSQVMTNLESKRRQYDLVDVARQRGFVDVEIVDDDLGRSASGTVARPGFDRLVAWLCAGKVGAVLCFDASRLARNGRDWHHLLELCGLVEARVIDLDGVYNPCRPNDRLLLGMKGSISEFELGVLREGDQQRIRDLEMQQAQYDASLAERRYAPAIRTIASLRRSWRRTGRLRSGASEIWRHASLLTSDQISRSTRTPSPTWRTICRRPGMQWVSRRGPASSCFGR